MDLIHKLGIDWKLIIAQIINFAILLFILYKFVYHPVLAMLDKRSRMIAKGLEDAKKSEELLKNIEEERIAKLNEAERKVGALLNQAKVDAETMKKSIVEEANRQSEDMLKRAQFQIAEEKEKIVEEAKREVVDYAIIVAGKVLEKEFDSTHQKKLTDAVLKEMQSTSL